MKEIIDCAYCSGKAKLHRTEKAIEYKKEQFTVVEHFYKCNKCGEEFTTRETDSISISQAYDQYRKKYNIPFPEDIAAIRNEYGLSGSSMATVLGLGTNSYTNYENGEMPTQALSNLIRSAKNPTVFLEMLNSAQDKIPKTAFEKAKQKIQVLLTPPDSRHMQAPLQFQEPDEFTGYRRPSLDRTCSVLTYAINNSQEDYNDKLKLNKLLFYVDFYHYKCYAKSITGMPYRAIPYGPAPTCYDNVFSYLEHEECIISKWVKEKGQSARELFESHAKFDKTLFSDDELQTIYFVVDQFKNTSTWDIVELSHREKAWKINKDDRNKIDYTLAFELKTI